MDSLADYVQSTTLDDWSQEPAQDVTEVEGGLFNAVFHVQGNTKHIYAKHFGDRAKDPSFPPLPTTAIERFTIAREVNHIADTIIIDNLPVRSAKIIGSDLTNQVIALEAVKGIPLYEILITENDIEKSRHIIRDIAAWLGHFHLISKNLIDKIHKPAEEFKRYKSDLQYYGMLEYISLEIRDEARSFVDSHLENSDTVILGDPNSRNIIVDFPASRMIDFEQAQIGEGVHDLAYIMSELVIANLNSQLDPEADIMTIWQIYDTDQKYDYISFRRHLAFQTLYRLQGPSKKVWSGHLSASSYLKVVEWCTQQFKVLFASQS